MPVASLDDTGAHYALMKTQNILVCRQEVYGHPDQDFQPFSAPFYIAIKTDDIMSKLFIKTYLADDR